MKCNIRMIWTTLLVYICGWRSFWAVLLDATLYLLCGSHLLFAETSWTLGGLAAKGKPSTHWASTHWASTHWASTYWAYRQQITEGKGRDKIVLRVTYADGWSKNKENKARSRCMGKKKKNHISCFGEEYILSLHKSALSKHLFLHVQQNQWAALKLKKWINERKF